MPKRRKKKGNEIPAWVVTFGDLMALMLVFFILLQMFSELKRDHEYQRVITAVREAFGYSGGIGVLPVDDPPLRSVIEQLELMAVKNYEDTKISQSDTRGIDGPHMRVEKIRDGIVFTIGGPATFEERSATVRPEMLEQLHKLATLLAGRNNKVVIRGHTANKYLSDGWADRSWSDLDELAFARARAVKDVLIEMGIDDRVFRLEAVGTREPARPRAVEPADIAENRRVEVIMSEQLVEDTSEDWLATDPDRARGR